MLVRLFIFMITEMNEKSHCPVRPEHQIWVDDCVEYAVKKLNTEDEKVIEEYCKSLIAEYCSLLNKLNSINCPLWRNYYMGTFAYTYCFHKYKKDKRGIVTCTEN